MALTEEREITPYIPQHLMRASMAMEMVRPLMQATQAAQAIAEYEALKAAIQRPDDIQLYKGRPFLKKSFWRRVAACFGLSLELEREVREQDEQGRLAYSVVYRAIAPNGRSMIGDGYCSRSENGHGDWPEHTVRATAHTRAKNRAISDLVGGGEVSAEEMQEEDVAAPQRPSVRPMTPSQPAPKPTSAKAKGNGSGNPMWGALKARAARVDITAWADYCRTLTGKDDAKDYTLADYDTVERDIAYREAEAQAEHELGITYTDDPAAPIGTSSAADDAGDLSTVGVGRHPAN